MNNFLNKYEFLDRKKMSIALKVSFLYTYIKNLRMKYELNNKKKDEIQILMRFNRILKKSVVFISLFLVTQKVVKQQNL